LFHNILKSTLNGGWDKESPALQTGECMPLIHDREPKRISLAQLPTPLVELKNLSRELGTGPIFVKRDDLTGLEVSGNKVRKLEYLVADAIEKGCDTLVTNGGFQSNHCRATAAIGARLGMRVRLILRATEPNPPSEGNLLLDRILGADISFHAPDQYKVQFEKIISEVMEAERRAGRKPYFFPVGASVPLGCWGYIRCFAELVEQLGRETKVDLFSSVGSAGTHTGLMLGRALLKCDNWRVAGVPISDSLEYFHRELRKLERATNDTFNLGLSESDTPIDLIDGFIGGGYAIPYPAAIDTLKLLAHKEGILLDPSYTAKGMTGMLETIRRGGVRPGAIPVFVHTGGVFGLMARRDLFA
jgi:D-cysteine desulfhydrase